MKVKFKKLKDEAVVPSYSRIGDAGLDITAINIEYCDKYIEYGTGLSFEIPEGHVGLLFPRSSLTNKDLSLGNAVGVIDENFRGEVKFRFKKLVHNSDAWNNDYYKVGDRIGQLIIIPIDRVELVESEELSRTNRGQNGYGSSGK